MLYSRGSKQPRSLGKKKKLDEVNLKQLPGSLKRGGGAEGAVGKKAACVTYPGKSLT